MNKLRVFLYFLLLQTTASYALPIGFYTNQGQLVYKSLNSSHFTLFHDERVPYESTMIVNSLESVRPILQHWFSLFDQEKNYIISSAVTNNASFANFFTSTIELQTMGRGHRDLFWHEYIHMMMYNKMPNLLGASGVVLSLAWIPAWFIEGLAESLSVSVGSDVQSGIERYHALSNDWPSFASLHHLYGAHFAFRGYATSGAFVRWLLMQNKELNITKFFSDLRSYSYPWYYVLSFNPLVSFMPMRQTLLNHYNATETQLYDRYKKQASDYWQKNREGIFWPIQDKKIHTFKDLHSIKVEQGQALMLMLDHHDNLRFHNVHFDAKTSWLTHVTPSTKVYPNDMRINRSIINNDFAIAIIPDVAIKTGFQKDRLVWLDAKPGERVVDSGSLIYEFSGRIVKLFESTHRIAWLEEDLEKTRLCSVSKDQLLNHLSLQKKHIRCSLEVVLPKKIKWLGSKSNNKGSLLALEKDMASDNFVWFAIEEQTLVGERYHIYQWHIDRDDLEEIPYTTGGDPKVVAFGKESIWLLVGENNRRSIRQLSSSGKCLGLFDFDDLVLSLTSFQDDAFILGLYKGKKRVYRRVNPSELTMKPCHFSNGHASPLTEALHHQPHKLSLYESLVAFSPWKTEREDVSSVTKKMSLKKESVPSLDQASAFGSLVVKPDESRPVKWQGRPLFLLPIVGFDDIYTYQLGLVSVPLMDRLQNETVDLSMYYGLRSTYPSFNLGLSSTRFWPTIRFNLFKRQRWNGYVLERDGLTRRYSYLDELGGELSVSMRFYRVRQRINLRLGMSLAHHKPYVGSTLAIEGTLALPSILLSHRYQYKRWQFFWQAYANIAPEWLNKKFDFNRLVGSASIRYQFSWLSSSLAGGVDFSRTRGKSLKTPALKEYYMPLKAYIPGADSGFSNLHFYLKGPGSLFKTRYGDTKVKNSLAWVIPVVKEVDRLFWILYVKRLDFTASLTYGGAWNQNAFALSRFVASHSYDLDLHLGNKGVSFSVGAGMGQVFGDAVQFYTKFAFQAIY